MELSGEGEGEWCVQTLCHPRLAAFARLLVRCDHQSCPHGPPVLRDGQRSEGSERDALLASLPFNE